MKSVFFIFIFLLMCAGAQTQNYNPGTQSVTSVLDTTTASGWTRLTGSDQMQDDIYGNLYVAQAFMMASDYDFYYSWTSSHDTYFLWRTAWGPYQNHQNLPINGVYVSPTFTASGSIDIYFESK